MTARIKINSDFEDYYDKLSVNEGELITYRRFYSDCMPRGNDLKLLRDIGIKTIDIRAAREFSDYVNKLVVYTNPCLHNSKGKEIITVDEARNMYSNNIASQFYECTNGLTVKFLQIGTRRFKILLQNNNIELLQEGQVVKIEELEPCFNYTIQKEIFSIDYISNGETMIAIDFNCVQKLDKLGFENIMKAEDVLREIEKASLAYNKLK